MGSKRNVVGLSYICDLLCFRQPAALLDIWHDDVRRLLLQEFRIAPPHVEVFAATDWRRR